MIEVLRSRCADVYVQTCGCACFCCLCKEEKFIFITGLAVISPKLEQIAARSCDKTYGVCLRSRIPYCKRKTEKQATFVQPEMFLII